LGRPSLITNLTSISRAALSGTSSIYLPKKFTSSRGRILELDEVFNSRFSFGGEYLHRQFSKEGLALEDNSEDEICFAVEELLARSISGTITETSIDLEIRKLQIRANSVARGRISNTFVQKNYGF
jgi:putative glycosyltransferase (TIGR04372 family)